MVPLVNQEVNRVAERVLGDVGSRLLLENERVRVWELTLEPGEESHLHQHTLDYVLIQVAGDRIAGVFEADSANHQGVVEADVTPGSAMFLTRGDVATARNIGTKPFHEIVVELKD
jgi:predicted metal-dependent enzyme (double-stranded beta helix superfamily)